MAEYIINTATKINEKWRAFILLIAIMFHIVKKEEEIKHKKKEPQKQGPECWSREHLHDWHENTLDKLEKIPEVEHYKEYIRMEHFARQRRIQEMEIAARKAERRMTNPKKASKTHRSHKQVHVRKRRGY